MNIDNSTPLVSIVSPVYNAELFVGRMLSSILSQTYRNIEMICVDDGSEDNTEAAIKSFAGVFAEKNMRLIYLRQEHGGQTRAVSAGLKLANGEYLSWVDSDDFITENSIATKLSALTENRDYGVATSDFYVAREQNLHRIIRRQGAYFGNLNFQSRQFYLALSGMSIIEANCHLVRMRCLDEALPGRELAPCMEGQNLQLTLPLYYRYRRLYIDVPLACYVIRDGSHYNRERGAEEWAARYGAFLETLRLILESLNFSALEIRKVIKNSRFNRER